MAMAYAESFRGGPKFCHNRVTSQSNLGSAEGTTIIEWSGSKPRQITPNNMHFRTFQIGSFSKTKKASAYASKSRTNPEYSRKASFAFAKTAWFCFADFHF